MNCCTVFCLLLGNILFAPVISTSNDKNCTEHVSDCDSLLESIGPINEDNPKLCQNVEKVQDCLGSLQDCVIGSNYNSSICSDQESVKRIFETFGRYFKVLEDTNCNATATGRFCSSFEECSCRTLTLPGYLSLITCTDRNNPKLTCKAVQQAEQYLEDLVNKRCYCGISDYNGGYRIPNLIEEFLADGGWDNNCPSRFFAGSYCINLIIECRRMLVSFQRENMTYCQTKCPDAAKAGRDCVMKYLDHCRCGGIINYLYYSKLFVAGNASFVCQNSGSNCTQTDTREFSGANCTQTNTCECSGSVSTKPRTHTSVVLQVVMVFLTLSTVWN